MSLVGILALQGDFEKHAQIIQKLGYKSKFIKEEESLNQCTHLIIPGGESTTFLKLIDRLNLRQGISKFGEEKPIFGTCAGLIILASQVVENDNFKTLGLIDMKVSRNAYGRQINSFIDKIDLKLSAQSKEVEAIFIRAPKILEYGKEVRPLAYHKEDVVMAANKNILVASFHPELTEDIQIHDYFLNHFV